MDKTFCRGWQIAKRNDGLIELELWSLAQIREKHAASRSQLVVIPEFFKRCARCAKDKTGGTLTRCDCVSLYTKGDMQKVERELAPGTLERYTATTRRRTVTVLPTQNVQGQPGGHRYGNFNRCVLTTAEMMQWLRYENRVNIFRLGRGRRALLMRQKRGCAMGGRGSKIKMSLILGVGEGLLWRDAGKLHANGFAIAGYSITQLVSLLRQVDDASCASWVWCEDCMRDLCQLAWGEDMTVTIEEAGQSITFCDTLEEIIGFSFFMTPLFANSPATPQEGNRITRFTPFLQVLRPVEYIRCLISGRMARPFQICGDHPLQLLRSAWELAVELHDSPNFYTWEAIRRGFYGVRHRPAVPILAQVREALKQLSKHDTNIRHHVLGSLGLPAKFC